MLLALVGAVFAGDGPWLLAPGERNVYVGSSYIRYGAYDAGGKGDRSLGGDVVATHTVLVGTLGFSPRLEGELRVPFETARLVDADLGICEEKPAGWCAPSLGVGDVEGMLKVRLVDELFAPVSVAALASARSGELYAARRGRLTNLGDGQTALGAGLSVGRTGLVGRGWYTGGATARYWHRVDPGRDLPDEICFSVDGSWAPTGRFGLGVVGAGFHRLGGISLAEMDAEDDDAFARLAASQLQAGAKASAYLGPHTSGGGA